MNKISQINLFWSREPYFMSHSNGCHLLHCKKKRYDHYIMTTYVFTIFFASLIKIS